MKKHMKEETEKLRLIAGVIIDRNKKLTNYKNSE
jgi:hypothetical protein